MSQWIGTWLLRMKDLERGNNSLKYYRIFMKELRIVKAAHNKDNTMANVLSGPS
jgi:hypothetical protein